MRLGVCYYPEHWPRERWAEDARRMREMGLTQVRIGEFAWSRIEPERGRFAWGWLDDAIATLAGEGLKIVLGTPTATPPRWLLAEMPDMVALDARGVPRGFGSRRHYCFSHRPWRAECARIVTELARRYGGHPAIEAWQTDNEFGCHDTVESFSPAAAAAFRLWLKARHGAIEALNAAWGNVFWSMEYPSFEAIDPPAPTVTEANPAHRLDWKRFGSDEVASFHALQAEILRELSPGRDVLHNFMGMFTQFDHFAVGAGCDVAAWDSYPLGFLETFPWPAATKERYLRQGHPDFTAFHHDLYREAGRGRWQVIEQQPGPVNWAAWNPAPLPGMVRAWTWESCAHGAECVSYFRWRQAPFAQEQMHAGLLRPDSTEAPGAGEAREVAAELARVRPRPFDPSRHRAKVGLLFDYPSLWTTEIQPQGRDFRPLEIVLAFYAAARRLGLDVDVMGDPDACTGYPIVLAPHLPIWPQSLSARLARSVAVVGPRAGSKTGDFQIPDALPPAGLRDLIDVRVTLSESLRPGHEEQAGPYRVTRWLDRIESPLPPVVATPEGHGIWWRNERVDLLATWPCPALLDAVLRPRAAAAGLETLDLPEHLRLRRRGDLRVAVNHAAHAEDLRLHLPGAERLDYVVGGPDMAPAGVAVWRER